MSLVSGSHPYDKDAVEQWFSEFLTAKENPDDPPQKHRFLYSKTIKRISPIV